MKSLFQIVKDHINHFYLIIRLSLFELKSNNNNHYLGMLWEVLNPLILIGIYWFVFGYGIREGSMLMELPIFRGCFLELPFGFSYRSLCYKGLNPSIQELILFQNELSNECHSLLRDHLIVLSAYHFDVYLNGDFILLRIFPKPLYPTASLYDVCQFCVIDWDFLGHIDTGNDYSRCPNDCPSGCQGAAVPNPDSLDTR